MQHQVHFMLDYKRGQYMPVDHEHLDYLAESSAGEGELSPQ